MGFIKLNDRMFVGIPTGSFAKHEQNFYAVRRSKSGSPLQEQLVFLSLYLINNFLWKAACCGIPEAFAKQKAFPARCCVIVVFS